MASLRDLMQGYEKLVILKTLQRNGFNVITSAKMLCITRHSLYRRIKKLKIDVRDLREIGKENKNG
jgi:transcriptional regulator with PAS, ATPase and Fis domain